RLYGTHQLSASDANTVDVTVTNGVSYVPIPAGIGERIAGLLTVDLPQTVVTGQEFRIIVRRVSTPRFEEVERVEIRSVGLKDGAPALTDWSMEGARAKASDTSTLREVSAALVKASPEPADRRGRGRRRGGDATTVDMLNWRYVV